MGCSVGHWKRRRKGGGTAEKGGSRGNVSVSASLQSGSHAFGSEGSRWQTIKKNAESCKPPEVIKLVENQSGEEPADVCQFNKAVVIFGA